MSINRDLLNAAREAGVERSAAFEKALLEKVSAARREQWKRENAEAITKYNELIEEDGAFSEGQRSF